jgi:hypothetical protein
MSNPLHTQSVGQKSTRSRLGPGNFENGLIQQELIPTREGLVVAMDFDTDPGDETSLGRSAWRTIKGIRPVDLACVFYTSDGLPQPYAAPSLMPSAEPVYRWRTTAAGSLIAIADEDCGLLLVQIPALDFTTGSSPQLRVAFSSGQLAHHPATHALAQQEGLDCQGLQVRIHSVNLGFAGDDARCAHLVSTLELKDRAGRVALGTVAARIMGNLSRGLNSLSIFSLEAL